MIYTLPVDPSTLTEDDVIDMSQSGFDSDPIRSSFIFIRNTELTTNYDFSKCSYEQKSEYLDLYMFGSFDVNIQLLTNTWIEILMSKKCDNPVLPIIFTADEVKRFASEHQESLSEIYNLIISLPMFALVRLADVPGHEEIADDIKTYKFTDYDRINLHNFALMTYNPDFNQMIEPIDGMKPLYYNEYMAKYHWRNRSIINNNLPYSSLLMLMLGSKEQMKSFMRYFKENTSSKEGKEDERQIIC